MAARTNVYFAGPLFTLAERRFNEELAAEMLRLCPALDLFMPQDCDKEFQGKPDFARQVYQSLMEALDRCHAVVAILDGPDSDSGTCVEIAYAHAKGKPVIGVRTDFRPGDVDGLNIMTAGICTAVVKLPSTDSTVGQVAERVVFELSLSQRQSETP
jgi:nucleoside 2-deoxyribosyltransferase